MSFDKETMDTNMDNDEIVDSEKDDSQEDSDDSMSSSSNDSNISNLDQSDECDKNDEYSIVIQDLEKQFDILQKVYRLLKNKEIWERIEQIRNGTATEYLQRLNELINNKELRIERAELVKKFRKDVLARLSDAEKLAAKQNYENQKRLLSEVIKEDIEEKILKLKEERNKADAEYLTDIHSKIRNDDFDGKRKKVITVTGPYIVLMLRDDEIMEDIKFVSCLRSIENNQRKIYR